FAPYLGVEWVRRFGASAGLARDRGEPAMDRRWVAGVRVWF
ncbi:MAG TPA: copper resistance protein B, partial [Mizugakiibacter sp.]